MTNDSPLVSAIIPVFNGERYLAEAIESVLAQSYEPVEIIVVDDGSTDGSAEVARRFAPLVQYRFQPNGGAGAARNMGARLAHGNYLAFLDADDLWLEDKLTQQMAMFAADPALDMAFVHAIQFRSPDLDEVVAKQLQCPSEPMPGLGPSALLVKRSAFFRVGPFRTNWQIGEFIDWYSKAMEQGLNSTVLPRVMVRRRLHSDNQGIRVRHAQIDYVRVLKASLDRRRQAGSDTDVPRQKPPLTSRAGGTS